MKVKNDSLFAQSTILFTKILDLLANFAYENFKFKVKMNSRKNKTSMLNSHEACEFLGIAYSTLLKAVKEGKIPHYKPGSGKNSRLFFDKDELLQYLRAGRR